MGWFVPALIAGVGAIGGALGNRQRTQTQQGQFNQTGTQNQTFSGLNRYTPEYDATGSNLRGILANMYTQRINELPSFMQNYKTMGLQGINEGAQSLRDTLSRTLAARGLSYSPAAATAEAGLESNRVAQGLEFTNQIPLVQDQITQQRLGDLAGFFSRLPVGGTTETSGTSQGTSTTSGTSSGSMTTPGNMLGGAFGGLGSLLAFLYGQGAFGNDQGLGKKGYVRNP